MRPRTIHSCVRPKSSWQALEATQGRARRASLARTTGEAGGGGNAYARTPTRARTRPGSPSRGCVCGRVEACSSCPPGSPTVIMFAPCESSVSWLLLSVVFPAGLQRCGLLRRPATPCVCAASGSRSAPPAGFPCETCLLCASSSWRLLSPRRLASIAGACQTASRFSPPPTSVTSAHTQEPNRISS